MADWRPNVSRDDQVHSAINYIYARTKPATAKANPPKETMLAAAAPVASGGPLDAGAVSAPVEVAGTVLMATVLLGKDGTAGTEELPAGGAGGTETEGTAGTVGTTGGTIYNVSMQGL